jgi:hypothetical protein
MMTLRNDRIVHLVSRRDEEHVSQSKATNY